MKKLFTMLFLGLILVSCSREEDSNLNENKDFLLSKIDLRIFSGVGDSKYFYFDYDQDKKLVKQRGGFVQIPGTIYQELFTNEIYTSIKYNNNTAIVEDFYTTNEITPPKNTKYYDLNSSQHILSKEIPNDTNPYLYQKLIFTYSDEKLTEIVTTYPNLPYDPNDPNDFLWTYSEKFYYDNNSNLTKTELFEQHNGINISKKYTRLFENYDNSSNPFKKLYLLDYFFYRTISKNNYRKYVEIKYTNNTETSYTETIWNFNYDSTGGIMLY